MDNRLQTLGQVGAAIIAALGATGYVILMGAVVLWARLVQAHLPRAVPISLASRNELLVLGAQALAVWIVLAIALVALGARVSSQAVERRDVLAGLGLGAATAIATLIVIRSHHWWVDVLVSVLPAASVVVVLVVAVMLRPPASLLITALAPVAVGVALPLLFVVMGTEGQATSVTIAAWVIFILVLMVVPAIARLRALSVANTTAVAYFDAEQAKLDRAAEITKTVAVADPRLVRLREALQQRQRALVTRLWVRGGVLAAVALIGLGGISVASQFDRANLFRSALVSLNTGRCIEATYISRDDDHVVLADRQGTTDANRIVVVPASEVLEIQILNPATPGVPLRSGTCRELGAVVTPDGTSTEPFRGPRGATGATGATGDTGDPGAQGDKGDKGDDGVQGTKGDKGDDGAQGKKGDTGAKGDKGTTGDKGAKGDRGAKGAKGDKGDTGAQGERGPAGPRAGS
ncbi:tail fiber protein [Baekduia alba]|uniref:hypothetical protein n=1 Tax=Baekduia alba TaxID=2997333 RepID=UPI00234144B5|nr:hypothetical protein [Baekduia alba]WCB93842.1 tail fiber protein [Baekduia alba]